MRGSGAVCGRPDPDLFASGQGGAVCRTCAEPDAGPVSREALSLLAELGAAGPGKAGAVMVDPYVFELSTKPFRLNREINATRARWQPDLHTWVWERGVVRDICGVTECKVQEFTVTSFPELTETPDDFLKEVKQDKQMNYLELRNYIDDLQRSGFDTVRLRVQFYKKFSVPLFVLVPISSALSFDVGTSYARADVRRTTGGQVTASTVSGLTDTQIRGNYTIGNDFVVLDRRHRPPPRARR